MRPEEGAPRATQNYPLCDGQTLRDIPGYRAWQYVRKTYSDETIFNLQYGYMWGKIGLDDEFYGVLTEDGHGWVA